MAKDKRMNRRMAGLLKARLPDPGLERVPDPRHRRGRRWSLPTLLRTGLAAMAAGCRSLAEGEALTDEQWLCVVRQHWAVENQCHNTRDTAFDEDNRPWIVCSPQGTLVVALLRRLSYNVLALFCCVSQRSEERRQVPWKELVRWMYNALTGAREADVAGLRTRQGVAAFV